jgi:hypothetical protein
MAFQYSDDGRWVWNGTTWIVAPPMSRYRSKQTNHVFHLLMTVFTVGLWFPVWAVVALGNALTREPY